MATPTLDNDDGQCTSGDYVATLRILGEPVTSKVVLEAHARQPFHALLPRIAALVGVAALWERYQLHPAVLVDAHSRKVRPRTHVVQPDDTLASLRLGPSREPHLFMLRYKNAPDRPDKASLSTPQSSAAPVTAQEAVHRTEAGVTRNGPSCVDGQTRGIEHDSGDSASHAATTTHSYRDRMIAMYNKYDKAQLYKVDLALQRYKGYEEDVIALLVKHYGPEPPAEGKSAADTVVVSPTQEVRHDDSVSHDGSYKESSGTSSTGQNTPALGTPAASSYDAPTSRETPPEQTTTRGVTDERGALADGTPHQVNAESMVAEPARQQPPARSDRAARTRCDMAVMHGTERLAAHSTHVLLRVYWQKWVHYGDVRHARRLLAQGTLWRRGRARVGDDDRDDDMSAVLADELYPTLTVPDLAAHLRVQREARQAGAWVISDAAQRALRELMAQLKRVAMQSSLLGNVGDSGDSDDDQETSRDVEAGKKGACSTSEAQTCVDEVDSALIHSLRRATQLLMRHGDVVEQLQRLRAERDGWQERLDELQNKLEASDHAARTDVALQAQLDEALRVDAAPRNEPNVAAAAPRVMTAAGGDQPHTLPSPPPAPSTTLPTPPTLLSDAAGGYAALAEPQREVLLARVHKKLATARTQVHAGGQREYLLRRQLEASTSDTQRLRAMLMAKHDGDSSRTQRGHVLALGDKGTKECAPTAAATLTPRRGRFSEPYCSQLKGNCTPRPTSNPLPMRPVMTRTPRGGTRVTLRHHQPSCEATTAVTATMTSSDGSTLDELPADVPRRAAPPIAPDVKRGTCPLCRARLTSCSPELAGPAAEAAAFCFRCCRAFSFAELAARDRILSLL